MRCCFCRRPKHNQDDEEYAQNLPPAGDRDDDADKKAVLYMRQKQLSKKAKENDAVDVETGAASCDEKGVNEISHSMESEHPDSMNADSVSDECVSTSTSCEDEISNQREENGAMSVESDSVSDDSDEKRPKEEQKSESEITPAPDEFANEHENDDESPQQPVKKDGSVSCASNSEEPNVEGTFSSFSVGNEEEFGDFSERNQNRAEEPSPVCYDSSSIFQFPSENEEERKSVAGIDKELSLNKRSDGSASDESDQCATKEHASTDSGNENEPARAAMSDNENGDVASTSTTTDIDPANNIFQFPPENEEEKNPVVGNDKELSLNRSSDDSASHASDQCATIEHAPTDPRNENEPVCATMSDNENGDVASTCTTTDIDSAISDRYEKACKLLHQSLFEHERPLTPSERAFLGNLISTVPDDPSDEPKSDIETASDALQSNPLLHPTQSDEKTSRTEEKGEESDDSNRNSGLKRRFKKNRVELSVSNGNDIEVSQLNPPTESGKSSMSSVLTVTERTPSRTSSESSNSMQGTACDSAIGIDEQTALKHGAHNSNAVQSNKKARVDEEEESQIVRFDGWSVSEEENRVVDDDSESRPFLIIGTAANDDSSKPHVLSPLVMEAMRGFLPYVISEENFWLKYSLIRDGSSLHTLSEKVRASKWTVIAIETVEGDVFGSFTGTPWRKQLGYYGSVEAFLWRLKKSRWAPQARLIATGTSFIDSEMEVYPHTGQDSLIQLCTTEYLAVGGGPWKFGESPYRREQMGIGLRIESDLLSGESKSSGTFANPPLCKSCEDGSVFEIMNLEVWTLTPCTTEDEAVKLEFRKLFIETHSS